MSTDWDGDPAEDRDAEFYVEQDATDRAAEVTYEARREAVARYLAYEYEQSVEAARVRASEILAMLAEREDDDPEPFAVGRRVEVHRLEGGYLVFPSED